MPKLKPPGSGGNKAPTSISLSNTSVIEETTGVVVGILTAEDPNKRDTITYTVSDTRFEVVLDQFGQSVLRLRAGDGLDPGASLNFEEESSVTVEITATDRGGLSKTQSFVITVEDKPEPVDVLIDFEGIAPQNDFAFISDGYADLDWLHRFYAVNDGFDGGSFMTALNSGEATGFVYPEPVDGEPATGFRSTTSDFDFVSGYFASHEGDAAQTVVVQGWDDDLLVATRTLDLTPTKVFIEFGEEFASIDKVLFIDTYAPNSISVDDFVLRYYPPDYIA